jgi:hypothetical protein
MPFGIILYDESRTIVAIDDTAAVIFGKPAQELCCRNLNDFVPKPDREQLAEVRATFERYGEASGRYALEHDDGTRESILYAVLANAPTPGLNLMAISPSDGALAADEARIRRVGDDVTVGLALTEDERELATGSLLLRSGAGPAADQRTSRSVVAGVFVSEDEGLAALLAIPGRCQARMDMGLSTFGNGWQLDRRSVLAVRGVGGNHRADIAAVLSEGGGSLMSGC